MTGSQDAYAECDDDAPALIFYSLHHSDAVAVTRPDREVSMEVRRWSGSFITLVAEL